ncbi:rCG20918, isoform CRA_a [Rattus norvegicus]|uniref:RCG20918, isoform CRA_a n=1 Tax=Rattus norvegicus TaxID=10116 RepID=A6JE65_RAT|nr:rCG20918, isoform CRA_a [Rattus norvegicus]
MESSLASTVSLQLSASVHPHTRCLLHLLCHHGLVSLEL